MCVKVLFSQFHQIIIIHPTLSDMLEEKCAKILFQGVASANTIKWLPSQFLLLWLLTCFFFLIGLVQTLQGAAMSQQPSLKKAPADHSSRQGGVGHRGRSYHRAAECEGQKSWCIQAHHTVTRHSSAQGPSEQAAFTLNRLLMSSPAQGLLTHTEKNLYE